MFAPPPVELLRRASKLVECGQLPGFPLQGRYVSTLPFQSNPVVRSSSLKSASCGSQETVLLELCFPEIATCMGTACVAKAAQTQLAGEQGKDELRREAL